MSKYHIQTIELTSAQAQISFNNIPQDFTDLELVVSARFAGSRSSYGYRFNNDSSSSYPWRRLYGNGSSAASGSGTGTTGLIGECPGTSETANTFGNGRLYIPNYTSSSIKSASADDVSENNAVESYQHIVANLWNNTTAINSISVMGYGGPSTNFAAGSTISLYGVKRGSDGVTSPAAQGGVVTTSGGYTIHTFNTSGTFTANRNLEVDYLVVAGGGGGGGNASGGGGAGGLLTGSTGITPQNYSILVGAGGAGGLGSASPGADGGQSFAIGLASIGGGGGGSISVDQAVASGRAGGSGGGGGTGYNGQVQGLGGAGTTGQGFAGGSGEPTSTTNVENIAGGAGGGSSSAGGSSTVAVAGNGGLGTVSSISGSALAYAGGGGGGTRSGTIGTGGSGVGGNGGSSTIAAQNGMTNRGGGGGGGRNSTINVFAGNGGSGVVIIRYLTP